MNGDLELLVLSGDALLILLVILVFAAWRHTARTIRELTEAGMVSWQLTAKSVPPKALPAAAAEPAEPAAESPVPGLREAS